MNKVGDYCSLLVGLAHFNQFKLLFVENCLVDFSFVRAHTHIDGERDRERERDLLVHHYPINKYWVFIVNILIQL